MNERHRLWMLRAAGAATSLASGGAATMLATHHSAQPIIGRYSLTALMALVLAAAATGASLALVALPGETLRRVDDWLREGRRALIRDVPRGTTRHGVILGLLALVGYVIIASRLIAANDAVRDDQADYLQLATDIRQSGGVVELWRRLWAGTYEANKADAANRHPLYLAVLSLHPEFDWAKRLSCALGLLSLGAVWWCTSRQSGWLSGGVAAVLLATNGVFQQSASLVACEMLLVAIAILAWFAIERCIDRCEWRSSDVAVRASASEPAIAWTERPLAAATAAGSTTASTEVTRFNRRCVVVCSSAGALFGLAYLTKASALFLLVGFVASSLFVAGLRRWSWLAVATFVIVASPLLVRNVRAFGDPLYSYNTRFLFSDSFSQGASRESRGAWRDAAEYCRTHSAASVARRAFTGLGWEAFILLRSLGPATFGASRPLVGLLVLLLALLGMAGRDARLVALAAVWCGIFLGFFAWYVPIASGDRFLAPLVPVVISFAARGTVSLIASHGDTSEHHAGRRILWAATLWVIATTVLSFRTPGQNALDWPKVGDYVRWSAGACGVPEKTSLAREDAPLRQTMNRRLSSCDGLWPRS